MAEPGVFTLEAEKALEKISGFQFPYPLAWTVKLAQAAVALGSPELVISQLSTETRFEFRPESWESVPFEAFYFDVTQALSPGLQHLKTGLWAAGLGQEKPFQIELPRSDEGYFWNGSELSRYRVERPSDRLTVSISHRTLREGKGWPVLRSIQAAMTNREILTHLKACLYTCPIPVSLDSQPLDGYENSPTHGFSSHTYPVHVFGFFRPDWRLVPRSPRPIAPGARARLNPRLAPICRDLPSSYLWEEEWSIVGVLAAGGGHYSSGKSSSWRADPRPSVLCWIRDGVIVQREELKILHLGVSVALHLNADGLDTDFSGFAIQEDQAAPIREAALQWCAEQLKELEADFHVNDRRWQSIRSGVAKVALAGGTVLTLAANPVAIPILVGGVFLGLSNLTTVEHLCDVFNRDYTRLRAEFKRRYGGSDASLEG